MGNQVVNITCPADAWDTLYSTGVPGRYSLDVEVVEGRNQQGQPQIKYRGYDVRGVEGLLLFEPALAGAGANGSKAK